MFPFLANLDITLMVAKDNLGIKLNQASTAIRHKAYETLPSIDIKKPNEKKKTPATPIENKPEQKAEVETDKKTETPKSETSTKTSSEPNKVEFEIPTPEPKTTEPEAVVEIIAPEEPKPVPEVVVGDGETMDYSNLVIDNPENEEELIIEVTPSEPILEVEVEKEKTSNQEDEETPPVYTRVEPKKRVPTQKDLDAVFSKWNDSNENKKKKGKGGA